MKKQLTTLSTNSAPGGRNSDEQLQPVATAPGNISIRLERISAWQQLASRRAWELKLIVFFTGMEITFLKTALGIRPGAAPADYSATVADTVSELTKGRATTWVELIELKCGMTERTARRYVVAYDRMCGVAPSTVAKICEAFGPCPDKPFALALPDPDVAFAKVPEEDMEAFREAFDPYSLSELYEKPVPHAIVLARNAHAKKDSDDREEQAVMAFWLDAFHAQTQRNSYLVLPVPQRKAVLETLETAVAEIKASLRREK